jgi:uncharacterized protein YlxW (UPF0749 family)
MSAPQPERRGASGPGARMLADLLSSHLDPGYAAAARRRAEDGPPPGPRGVRKVAAVTGALLIGLVLAVAYREAVATAPASARTRTALVEEVEQRSARTDALQARAEGLRRQVARDHAALLARAGSGTTSTPVGNLEVATGLGAVEGPGVVVTIGDGPASKDPVTGGATDDGDLARVQDRDLQDVVNALWASGAEAVSIDGQRLATTSAIRSAGAAVLVDFRPVESPYVIRAIGSPDTLQTSFDGSGAARRFRGYEKQYGMTFTVRRTERLELSAAPAPDMLYARELRATPAASGGSPAGAGTSAVPSPTGGGR